MLETPVADKVPRKLVGFVNNHGSIYCRIDDASTGKSELALPKDCPIELSQYLSRQLINHPAMRSTESQTNPVIEAKIPIFDLLDNGTPKQFRDNSPPPTPKDVFDYDYVPHKILSINKAKREATCLFAALGSDPVIVSLDRLIDKCPLLVINFCS